MAQPANTIAANRDRGVFDPAQPLWIFGYGSLIFKADFPFLDRKPAIISGWERRFWQGSHDHRGTPQKPGRVVTLVESQGSQCLGMGYLIDPVTLEHLDYREKNGYLRFSTVMAFEGGIEDQGLVYIATEDNPAWLGPAPEWKIAAQIGESVGPSGRNIDYLFALSSSLRKMSADDPHVYEIEGYLKQKHVAP